MVIKRRGLGRYRRAVFIVVYRLTEQGILYLIMNRKKHWKGWEFPKGGIEKGETMKQTVSREVREETGQNSSNVRGYNVFGRYMYKEKLKDRPGIIGQTYSLYSSEIKSEKVKFDINEHSGYCWLGFEEAEKKLSKLDQKRCLKIVNNFIKEHEKN